LGAPATILSRAQCGIEAPQVRVEVHLGAGLPCFSIVGLPEAVVKESRERVRSAIATSQFEFPQSRITVNLAPADLPKEGGRFDLPIALGVLVASDQLRAPVAEDCEFYGELSLTGALRAVRGMLPSVCQAVRAAHRVVVPRANLAEGALVERAQVAGAEHLREVCGHLRGDAPLEFASGVPLEPQRAHYPDLADVRGQAQALRALEVAAAGAHGLLMSGPPGSGKSMLAHRLCGILPPMSLAETLEAASVLSVSTRGFRIGEWGCRPFRAPHHTASAIAIAGGGVPPRPGEISLAHNGVLFLDELPEFERAVLEVLREPLETGSVVLSRGSRQAEFPARFQFVAAMNPCPCGYAGDASGRCRCSESRLLNYRSRISGPLLDRIDIHIDVPRPDAEAMANVRSRGERSASVAERVRCARELQTRRAGRPNAHLSTREVEDTCNASPEAERLIRTAMSALGLSARAYHRLLRVARTIADLDGGGAITLQHAGEAIQLRRMGART